MNPKEDLAAAMEGSATPGTGPTVRGCRSDAAQRLSPITLTIVWNSLISTAEEMGATLWSTAFSEAVREGEDFSAGIFDRRGRLAAQGNFTPGQLGAMPYVVKHALEVFPPRDLHPGDGILLNDSYMGAGHYPDFFLISPVFDSTELIGYVLSSAHHVDVGGAGPGSQAVAGVTEAYQEGLRILPVRVFREGMIDPDIWRIILGNVRLPDKLEGDLLAQRNANHVGSTRLVKLFHLYGHSVVEQAIEEILNRSEHAMRERIAAIPDGVYSFEDRLDDAGPGTQPIRVHVTVTVAGDEITVDFSQSSDQVPAALNSYINYTRAYVIFNVKVFTGALLPQNEGILRPIHTVARPGSFFNPCYPAPSGGRAVVQTRVFDAINGALAQALPERAMGSFSHWSNPNIGGVDDRTGRRFVMYDLIMGGYGGRSTKDGAEALCPIFNARNIPVEVHEATNPVLIRYLGFIRDSGGPGRFRGGCGLRKDVELLASRAVLTNLCDRHRFPPYGLLGGKSGRLAETLVNGTISVPSKGVHAIERGNVISFRTAGAGGYGDPLERDPSAVRNDVVDGYVSLEQARHAYGVVLDPDKLTIDAIATAQVREAAKRNENGAGIDLSRGGDLRVSGKASLSEEEQDGGD